MTYKLKLFELGETMKILLRRNGNNQTYRIEHKPSISLEDKLILYKFLSFII